MKKKRCCTFHEAGAAGFASRIYALLFVLGLWLLCAAAAPLQDSYSLVVNKTMGFNNGSQIRGAFRAELVGTADGVRKVTFLLDGQVLNELSAPPFRVSFNTTDYGDGPHSLGARVERVDGQVLTVPERHFTFVSAQAEADFMRNVVLPILGGVFLLVVVGLGSQFIGMRRRANLVLPLGAPRRYGMKGGGICPRCHRPFGLHWWSPNLISGVYDRCDFCGYAGFIRPASASELASAEAAEAAAALPEEPPHKKSEEEKLKDRLDDSRFSG